MGERRIGILGGTFNPPHLGHIHMARTARELLRLDEVRFIPTGDPPHKALPEGSPTSEDRFAMTCRAAALLEGSSVLRIEIDRQGKSYTADTVALLHEREPEAKLWLIVGSDMLESFERWKRPEEIVSHCRLAALCRAPGEEEALCAAAVRLQARFGDVVDLLLVPPHPASSTDLRALLAVGRGEEELPPEVLEYIREKRLYHFDEQLCRQRALVHERLSSRRFAHTMGCEETAARLARRWAVCERDARQAAILHDMTKNLTTESQLNLCVLYDIMSESVGMPPTVLHALTGAEMADRECHVSDRVKQAIRWHTTGRKNMTPLEKVVYLADIIEPGRKFPDAQKLRQIAYEDLDGAVAEALEGSLRHLKKTGEKISPETIEAYDFLRAEQERKNAASAR